VRPRRTVGISVSTKEAANAQFQIKSRERIKKVTQELQNREFLGLDPLGQEDWLEAAQKAIKVAPVQATTQGTSFINIEYADVNVEWAVDFLRALRNDWTSDVIERDTKCSPDLVAAIDKRAKLVLNELADLIESDDDELRDSA
jgi:predicted metal-dependent RNase